MRDPATPSVSRLLAALAGSAFALGGCSTEAWYEGVRQGAERQCLREPDPAPCRARLNTLPYDAYSRERTTPPQP